MYYIGVARQIQEPMSFGRNLWGSANPTATGSGLGKLRDLPNARRFSRSRWHARQAALFCALACRRAAHRPARPAGKRCAIVEAIVFHVKGPVGGCFIEFGNNRIAAAFVAAR